MKKLVLSILSVFLVLPSAEAQFECVGKDLSTKRKDEVVQKLEERYRRLEGLSGKFTQDSLFLGFNERVRSEGTVFFKKPGMMDWNYLAPEKQRFVADGRSLWFYQPEMNQVTIGQFQQSFQSGLPVSFLLGLGSLTQDFTVTRACSNAAGVVLMLSPKSPDPSLQEFKLLIDPKDNLPHGAHVVDVGGNETQILFTDLRTDIALKDAQFQFTVPRGVDIIDQRDGAGVEQ